MIGAPHFWKMSGAEVSLAESKSIPLEDDDENKGEEESEPSTIIYCNDFSIIDDEIDSDDNVVAKEDVKSFVQCHGKMPGLSSKGPENVTEEGKCKTESVKDTVKHPIKTHLCSSGKANFSKLPVDQMKEKMKNPPDLDLVVIVQGEKSSPDGLDRELPSEIRSFPSQPGSKTSSRNKNVAVSKMTDCVKGTPDNPNIITEKNLSKSARSIKSNEGSINQAWYFETKKAKGKRKSKGSTYRQMLRKRYHGISRKYGKTYMVQQNTLSPISLLKRYAEKFDIDFAKLIENADSIGLDLPFPCTECYFKKKTADTYSNPFDMLANLFDNQDVSMDTKCPDCGAERMTLGGYGKMIANLRRMIEYRNLLVHDVYPDGNCLYAAIVDQLRIRGDFSWTCNRLREGAVDYLRENPLEEDGTHKEMYLDRETWEEYLERNSEDGEWGDHIMMSAIVEVLQRKIVILGGVSGKARNVIVPKSMRPAQRSDESGEPTSNQPIDKKVEKKKEELEEVEEKKKKEMRDEIGKNDKMDGETKEEEDKETKTKRMREEAVQRKEKEDDELEDETCLYLGHLSESHFISLRKRGWDQVSLEKMVGKTQRMKQQLKKENPDLFQMGDEIDYIKAVTDKNEIDPLSKEPLLHLDFIVKQMLEGYFERSSMSLQLIDDEMYTFELLGSRSENMYPQLLIGGKTLMSRYASGELLFCFPNSCPKKESQMSIIGEDMLFYCTPRDTRVYEKDFQNIATATDLIEEPARNMSGTLYLIPKKSKSWKGHLAENKDGKICLQHIPSQPRPISLSTNHGDTFQTSVKQIIAFKYQWPAEAAEWISRERPVNWPPAKVIEEIINRGCHVIPVAHGESIQGMDIDTMTWEYSFCVAEKSLLLSSISEHQQTCFFIFRLLVERQLQISQSFPYQVLKNIFLFACETFDDKMWSKQPGMCILHMLSKLVFCLDKGEAPMYFMPSKNLIKYVPRETTLTQAQQLEVLRFNPIISLYWLLDEYNLTSSDVGVTLDDVIADLSRFSKHHNLSKSVYDMLLPASFQTATDHIECSEYSSAFQVIMDIYQEMGDYNQLKEDISIADFVRDNFSDLQIGYLWGLALYVDLNAGTNLVPDICLEYDCSPISDMFGPEIIEYLGDKPVPNMFTRSWDLKFAKGIVIVLRSVDKYKAITVGLRYFLDAREEFVRENSVTDSYYGKSLFSKVSLYLELYNAYRKCNEASEFADLLERFEKIVFKLDHMEAYTYLSVISHKLGKEDLMRKASKKASEKYQSGSYRVICSCGECKLTLSSSDLFDEDDLPFTELLPPKSTVKKNKPVTSSNEKKGTAGSRPYDRYSMEKLSVSDDENDLEEPPLGMISSLSLLLGNMRNPSPARRSLIALLLPPYDSSGDSGNSF